MKAQILFTALVLQFSVSLQAQDPEVYRLRLDIPLFDYPQNLSLPGYFPSMNQSLEWSRDFYELGFYGIDALGNAIFRPGNNPGSQLRNISNHAFKYLSGLAFSRYASELPIPLGVWAHEEFHRTVLGEAGVPSKNGNWLFHRWDGTVYGIPDEMLEILKADEPDRLLNSYVAGVQYEVILNRRISTGDFYHHRSLAKNALLLYNAWYVHNYFRFSTSAASDSVKIIAPPHEDPDPALRDYAGADLTAWAADMFNPGLPYTETRDPFPNGEGVNRRVGFSDLSSEAQEYLVRQKRLSLLNFLNPAIFFVNRIRLSPEFSFNLFTQYAPTHFGNDIALLVPLKIMDHNLLVNAHRYGNRSAAGYGIGLGVFDFRLSERMSADMELDLWNQPASFWLNEKKAGGSLSFRPQFIISRAISGYIRLSGKTHGWQMGNPYLEKNLSVQLGLNINVGIPD